MPNVLPSDRIHIGCAGWSIPKAFADRFPTEGTHLARYAGGFQAVEINSSFYRPHRPATYQRWAESVPGDFRFAVKMPKAITHSLGLRDAEQPLGDFLDQCTHLGDKLGPVLVQLPPSLAFTAEVAQRFWQDLRARFSGDVVCEPRHASWFSDRAEAVLTDYSIARVAADPALGAAAGVPGGHRRLVYYRLHGTPRIYYSAYDRAFLNRVAGEMAAALRAGANVWCIFDNTADGAAVPDAIDLGNQLATELNVNAPS
jgi:uncharacterized protein YecE (DUF72 family)